MVLLYRGRTMQSGGMLKFTLWDRGGGVSLPRTWPPAPIGRSLLFTRLSLDVDDSLANASPDRLIGLTVSVAAAEVTPAVR